MLHCNGDTRGLSSPQFQLLLLTPIFQQSVAFSPNLCPNTTTPKGVPILAGGQTQAQTKHTQELAIAFSRLFLSCSNWKRQPLLGLPDR